MFDYIPEMDWYIAVGIDKAEAYSSTHLLKNVAILFTFISFLIIVWFSFYVFKKILLDNIFKLIELAF